MSEVYFVKGTRSCDYRNDMENIWAIYNLQRRMGGLYITHRNVTLFLSSKQNFVVVKFGTFYSIDSNNILAWLLLENDKNFLSNMFFQISFNKIK